MATWQLFGVRVSTGNPQVALKATGNGGLHVAQSLPAGTVVTKVGRSWTVISTTAVAALADEPTTAALGTLWNGESDGGSSYVIERIFAYQDVSAAAASRWALWACVHPIGRAADTADITLINSLRGLANYGGSARFDVDTTVTNDGWSPWSNSLDVETTGTLGGAACSVDVAGRMVIPPSAALSLHVVASSTDEDFTVGVHWHEVKLDLG